MLGSSRTQSGPPGRAVPSTCSQPLAKGEQQQELAQGLQIPAPADSLAVLRRDAPSAAKPQAARKLKVCIQQHQPLPLRPQPCSSVGAPSFPGSAGAKGSAAAGRPAGPSRDPGATLLRAPAFLRVWLRLAPQGDGTSLLQSTPCSSRPSALLRPAVTKLHAAGSKTQLGVWQSSRLGESTAANLQHRSPDGKTSP